MNIEAGIIAGALVAAVALVVLGYQTWVTADRVSTLENILLPLEQEIAGQNEVIKKLQVDKTAQDVIIKLQSQGIEKLQAQVRWLEAEAVALKMKFDKVIAWVRTVVPDKDVVDRFDRFLAQLEIGQGG